MRLILPVIVATFIVVGGYFVFNKPIQIPLLDQTSSASLSSTELKTLQSKMMEFSVNIPSGFSYIETAGRITVSDTEGKLYIERNSTNFDNIKDYLEDLNASNKVEIIEEEEIIVEGQQAVSRVIKFETGEVQKEIVIFSGGWIYNFFTNTQPLYPVLDQIAQSFRYTP